MPVAIKLIHEILKKEKILSYSYQGILKSLEQDPKEHQKISHLHGFF